MDTLTVEENHQRNRAQLAHEERHQYAQRRCEEVGPDLQGILH